ncbi:serine/threonine-protein kinase [Serratia quinivorans]|uniref:serine/threonine-protein kinase n=1 Tax=Serratia quinivorans TaxID=137545 RepID=UPI00217ADB64|nr:serine/threonine-protein kinase [Serratia quinivorans]CAI1092785.1 Serine/threonine-protein kinase PrkC [Serratia quinivorans]
MIKNGDIVSQRYQVIKHAGKGGMQDVFLARDLKLDIDVALKTPLPGLEAKRFSSSAKIAAKVNHHNVAKTLDYFEENDQVFLVEEFVHGETLEDKLEHFGLLDPHFSACIFHNLAKGIMASHQAGVVHRDLKPSNIMVTTGVAFEQVKITDFGIASLTNEFFAEVAESGDLTLSTSGTIRGALPFMAPEMMFRKKGDVIKSSADIWSLGAMMFKLMTGIYPFGVYLEAAVNVKGGNREPWPSFMTENNQFEPLALALQNITDNCLKYSPQERPTAKDLVGICEELCYLSAPRELGDVTKFIQNGYSGFINGEDDVSFFSIESVYGPTRPDLANNSKVCFSKFPGNPRGRAHPVIVWKK